MKRERIDLHQSIQLRILHQQFGISAYELTKQFPNFAERSIYRHAKRPIKDVKDGRHKNKGRPCKLKNRDERNILRSIQRLRKERAAFSSKKIQEEAGLTHEVSNKSVRRVSRKNRFRYCQTRKKGLLSHNDKKERLVFARANVTRPKEFWSNNVNFYFDGVGFAHKFNPSSEARATSSMTWRLKKEGTKITTKGNKEGSGGRMANFFVGISHGHGVVLCKHYPWTLTGEKFAGFVKCCFPLVFEKCGVPLKNGTFLQDGDPRQNSSIARNAWENMGITLFRIPPRSPDINCIENLFKQIREKLREDALCENITHETFDEFCKRVSKTFAEYPVAKINKLVESMPQRLRDVIKLRGARTKY